MEKKESRWSKNIIVGAIILVLGVTIAFTVIFCFKGSYPETMYVTLCGAVVAELAYLWRLEVDKRNREWKNSNEGGHDNG